MARPKASVVMDRTAFRIGWTRMVAVERMFLIEVTARSMSSVTENSFLVIAKESVRGQTMWAS